MTDGADSWARMVGRLEASRDDPARPHVGWQWYVDGVARTGVDLPQAIERSRAGEGYIWCGLRDPDDDTMETFQGLFGLHDLVVEDAVEGHDRSKLEVYGDRIFMVVSTVDYVAHVTADDTTNEIVSTGQVMVYLGTWFVLTSRHGGRAMMNSVRAEFESDPDETRMGPWRVLYRILDHVIDDFNQTVREIEWDVEEVESVVFGRDARREIDRPYELKRELIEFKRCVFPLSQPVLALQTRELAPIPPEARAYFREVSDHLLAARESVAAMDEVLGTIIQAALARATYADGVDMRKISAAVALFAVPTTIGAIYGMNFDNMPELHTEYGYYVVLAVMAAFIVALVVVFRRIRWL